MFLCPPSGIWNGKETIIENVNTATEIIPFNVDMDTAEHGKVILVVYIQKD